MMLPPTTLGITFACRDGLDAQFSLAQSDEEIVEDEVLHRMTTDKVLGSTPEAQDWGRNVFRRCGATLSDGENLALGPEYSEVLQRSPLIEHADVAVSKFDSTPGLIALEFAINVTPKNPVTDETGAPLSFIFRLTAANFFRVGNPDATAET